MVSEDSHGSFKVDYNETTGKVHGSLDNPNTQRPWLNHAGSGDRVSHGMWARWSLESLSKLKILGFCASMIENAAFFHFTFLGSYHRCLLRLKLQLKGNWKG